MQRGHYRAMSLLRSFGQAVALLSLSCAVGAASSAPTVSLPAVEETALPVVWQTGWVTDAADLLPDEVEQRLAAKLAELDRQTQHQMVVVTLPTLAGHDVADVADHLGRTWRIGRAADGVVVLVAPNERKLRISTADGIRETLPYETCSEIIEQSMIPHFREGDFPGGIEAGADALIARLE